MWHDSILASKVWSLQRTQGGSQPDGNAARTQLRAVVDQLTQVAPQVADRLQAMEDDLLAYTAFPPVHWTKIWSNNPIERLNANSSAAPTWSRSSPISNR